MSFGWSAGDIVSAISIVIKVVKALDGVDGATADFRKAVAFLSTLQATLERVQRSSGIPSQQKYEDEIKQHVAKMKPPIDNFLLVAAKFIKSLGESSGQGHHKSIKYKLQWRFIESKAVERLQKEIESHIRMLDLLIHRLTLDMIIDTSKNMGTDIQQAITDVLDPRLAAHVEEHLLPLSTAITEERGSRLEQHNAVISLIQEQSLSLKPLEDKLAAGQTISEEQHQAILQKLQENEANLTAGVDLIKKHLKNVESSGSSKRVKMKRPSSAVKQRKSPPIVNKRSDSTTVLISGGFEDPEGSGTLQDETAVLNQELPNANGLEGLWPYLGSMWLGGALYASYRKVTSSGTPARGHCAVDFQNSDRDYSRASRTSPPQPQPLALNEKAGTVSNKLGPSSRSTSPENRKHGSEIYKLGNDSPTKENTKDFIGKEPSLKCAFPPSSFLFVVNELQLNEEPEIGGVMPRVNEHGRWLPPTWRAGFLPQLPGTVFRWTDGKVSAADGYQWYNGAGWGPPGDIQLAEYRITSMFYSNPFTQYLAAKGDATTRDMAISPFPDNRWYPLSFFNEGAISRVTMEGEDQYLAGTGATWITQFGLRAYGNREGPDIEGLAGDLPTVIALMAFSCQYGQFDNILLHDRAWRGCRWRCHNRHHGHNSRRGVVATVYLDPENPAGSTSETLYALEWTRSPLIR